MNKKKYTHKREKDIHTENHQSAIKRAHQIKTYISARPRRRREHIRENIRGACVRACGSVKIEKVNFARRVWHFVLRVIYDKIKHNCGIKGCNILQIIDIDAARFCLLADAMWPVDDDRPASRQCAMAPILSSSLAHRAMQIRFVKAADARNPSLFLFFFWYVLTSPWTRVTSNMRGARRIFFPLICALFAPSNFDSLLAACVRAICCARILKSETYYYCELKNIFNDKI